VHLFNSKLINHLKEKFGADKVKKIYYFSDGAGSQYKNKFNFLNLARHQKDFAVQAEWHFFSTSHGKGACDGLGGTIERFARIASLQRVDGNHITTPNDLFLWAQSFFKNISFEFCSSSEHEEHEKKLKPRFEQAQKVQDTRTFHCFRPLNQQKIAATFFSSAPSNSATTCFVTKKAQKVKEFQEKKVTKAKNVEKPTKKVTKKLSKKRK